MIRPLSEKDYNIAIDIVNTNWKRTYSNYVNPSLLNEIGCKERAEELKNGYVIDKNEYLGEPYLTFGIRLIKTLM